MASHLRLSVGAGGLNVALRPLDILSICTGGGGLDLGIELAIPGVRSVCLVEREAFAVAHLVSAMEQGLMAPVPVWSDARTFDGRRWRGCVDGLIGGIPCQPHSLAGKRLGQEDERDLWSDARRILVQSGAWFVLIENVGGMLSSGGGERVWRDLGRLGFAREVGLFAASEVGAPHGRERVFILAIHDGRGVGQANAYEREPSVDLCFGGNARTKCPTASGVRRQLADASGDGQQWSEEPNVRAIEPGQQAPRRRDAERRDPVVVDSLDRRRRGRTVEPIGRPGGRIADERAGEGALFPPGPSEVNAWRSVLERAPHLEPAVRGLADGLASTRIDWLRLLGNGVVPLQAAYAIRTLATRLAGRGSAGATRLVRLMEAAE